MRFLFVNGVHPSSELVGSVRLQRLAEELAKRGHQVLLLGGIEGAEGDSLQSFVRRLDSHDWTHPFLLSICPDAGVARPARAMAAWPAIRRLRTAGRLVVHGGPFWRWRRAVAAFMDPIGNQFSPDLVYATFGALDSLVIARTFSRCARIPWVMDLKDPASEFLPKRLAGWLMRPYRSASAVTLNSEFQRTHNGQWADSRATVIYSGVEARSQAVGGHHHEQVALVGSLYSDHAIEVLLQGFQSWRAESCPDAVLHYFGVDSARFATVARQLGLAGGLMIDGQVSRTVLLARCSRMSAIMYAAHPQLTFHHKLLELGALGRPLISSPADGKEARHLCDRFGIKLICAIDAPGVKLALSTASASPTEAMELLLQEMSWPTAATRLESVFANAMGNYAASRCLP